jgi:hypothetical protein
MITGLYNAGAGTHVDSQSSGYKDIRATLVGADTTAYRAVHITQENDDNGALISAGPAELAQELFVEGASSLDGNMTVGTDSLIVNTSTDAITAAGSATIAGNLGVGSTTPASTYKLDVTGQARTTTGAHLATASGNVGIGTTAPAEKFDVNGIMVSNNDQYYTGDGSGIPYGSCWGNEIGWSQASAAQNTWYNISDTDMTDGHGGLNLVTHDGSGKLTVTKAGRYMVHYTMAAESSSAVHLMSGIELNNTGSAIDDGRNHLDLPATDKQGTLSGVAIVDLAASATIEVAISTTDASTPTLSVDHLNIAVTMVGGT